MIEWAPININTIVIVVGWIAGAFGAWYSVKNDLLGLKKDVVRLEEGFRQLSTILTQVAVQDARLGMIERAVDELRHGQGFITK